jgi:uncharacterized protein (DUF983 family)
MLPGKVHEKQLVKPHEQACTCGVKPPLHAGVVAVVVVVVVVGVVVVGVVVVVAPGNCSSTSFG